MIVYDCHVFAVNIINFVNYAYFLFVECRQNCCEAVGYAHASTHTREQKIHFELCIQYQENLYVTRIPEI